VLPRNLCGGIKSREKPIESHKVAPAAARGQLIPTISGSARFGRE